MFREMRRYRQALSDAECEQILCQGAYGVLSMAGDDGYPYGVPLNYVWYKGRIIFHGATSGHKADAMERKDKVSFCVVDRSDVVSEKLTTYYRSVILFGRARMISDESELREAATALGLRFNPDEAFVREEIERTISRLACFEIIPEHITGKQCIELLQGK